MRILLLLACCMAFAGGASAQMTIKGTIEGADSLDLTLVSEDGQINRTINLPAGGTFSFTVGGKPAAEDMFALILAGNPAPMLLLGGQPAIEIIVRKEHFPVVVDIRAGEQTRWMQDYHLAFQPLILKTKALNEEAGEIDGADDKATAVFRKKAEAFEQELVKTGTNFIKGHPKAHASLYLLVNELQSRISQQEMTALFNGLDPLVRNSRFGKVMAQQLSGKETSLAPDFSQKDPKGNLVKLSSFRGQYVLLDFWASWCGPCRAENPNIAAAYRQYKDRNFTVLGVSLDDNRKAWLEAIEVDKLAWTQVSDLKGTSNEAARLYRVQSIPQNFLIDPAGRVIAADLRGKALQEQLAAILP